MTWFESLTGCSEKSSDQVRSQLYVDGSLLHSRANGRSWFCGELEVLTLAQLRDRVRGVKRMARPISVREVVANIQDLHADSRNANALFQVASQFNLLEMVSPHVSPEHGVGIYERDRTQGPACAIAAGAGTIFRNYFAMVNGRVGQSAGNQIDCLSSVGSILGNTGQRLWRMVNGYAIPSTSGLQEVDQQLRLLDESGRDQLRQALKIGLQTGTQVTLPNACHVVSQAYCSALPVAYSTHAPEQWANFAKLVLEASYEATICAAIVNAGRTNNNTLFLTMLGGGAFGNELDWITGSIRRALSLYKECGLDVAIVSYGRSQPFAQEIASEFCGP